MNLVKLYDYLIHKTFLRKGFFCTTKKLGNHHIFYYDNQKENVPILLFVHGFGGNGKISWRHQVKAFHKNYRVIIPDILWFGKSKSTAKPTLNNQIIALEQLVNYLQISNFHFIGISYGGFIGLGYAKKQQEKLASLTIIDAPGVFYSDEKIKEFCQKVGVKNIADAFVPKNSKEVKRLLSFSFEKFFPTPLFIRKQAIGVYASKHPVKQRELLNELPQNKKYSKKQKLNIPVFILWGEEDQVFDVSLALKLQKQLDAKLKIIPKAGHALPEDQPKAMNKALKQFLKELEETHNKKGESTFHSSK